VSDSKKYCEGKVEKEKGYFFTGMAYGPILIRWDYSAPSLISSKMKK